MHASNNDINFLSSEQTFEYAKTLFLKNDYYRSITEFKRYIFFGINKEKKEEAELYIGLNYLKGQDYNNAKQIFYDISDNLTHSQRETAAVRLADTFLSEEKTDIKQHKHYYYSPAQFSTSYYINYLKEYNINNQYYDEANKKLILVYLLNLNKYKAFYLINNTSKTDEQYQKLVTSAKKINQIPQKSNIVAVLFSIFMPGMGQVYAGEVKKGFVALAVNVSMGFAAYYSYVNYSKLLGVFIGQYELTFYVGNINNTYNAVEKYNENQKNIFRQQLLDLHF